MSATTPTELQALYARLGKLHAVGDRAEALSLAGDVLQRLEHYVAPTVCFPGRPVADASRAQLWQYVRQEGLANGREYKTTGRESMLKLIAQHRPNSTYADVVQAQTQVWGNVIRQMGD